ncbi:MAG: DUF4115 domain-containing protein, partial [Deltaproteobacteria bacterium]|nr:DUF4115 domain-containing protein [Deltaproteobacteria bacterium]
KDRFDLLPPRVFVKGFVRAYVQELGLNPEETMARFETFIREGELPDYGEEEHPVFHQRPFSSSFISSRWFTAVLTAAGLVSLSILLLAGASRLLMWEKQARVSQPMVKTAQPAGYAPSALPPDPRPGEFQSPFGPASSGQSGKKVLEIRALSNAWVRVAPDNGPGEELMMSAGDIQRFTADKGFSLQTGNAGGIRLRFDGRELPTLGKINQTLSLTLP